MIQPAAGEGRLLGLSASATSSGVSNMSLAASCLGLWGLLKWVKASAQPDLALALTCTGAAAAGRVCATVRVPVCCDGHMGGAQLHRHGGEPAAMSGALWLTYQGTGWQGGAYTDTARHTLCPWSCTGHSAWQSPHSNSFLRSPRCMHTVARSQSGRGEATGWRLRGSVRCALCGAQHSVSATGHAPGGVCAQRRQARQLCTVPP